MALSAGGFLFCVFVCFVRGVLLSGKWRWSPLFRLPGTRQFAAEAPPSRRWRTDDYGVPNTGDYTKSQRCNVCSHWRVPTKSKDFLTCGELVPCQATEDPRDSAEKPQALASLIQRKLALASHKLCMNILGRCRTLGDRPEKRKVTGLFVNRRNQFPLLFFTIRVYVTRRMPVLIFTGYCPLPSMLCSFLPAKPRAFLPHPCKVFITFCFWVRNQRCSRQ